MKTIKMYAGKMHICQLGGSMFSLFQCFLKKIRQTIYLKLYGNSIKEKEKNMNKLLDTKSKKEKKI